MKTFLRWTLCIVGVLLVVVLCAAGYLLLIQGRAPATRADLVRVPVQVQPPAKGYPTTNALYLAFALNQISMAKIQEDHPAPEGVTVEKNIAYANLSPRNLLDVYRPKPSAKAPPILLFIHGGGWSGGDKHDYEIYCNRFAEWGYVVASMMYRLAPENKYPACIQDTNAAIRFLRANAARFGGDPDRIAVIGGSAGGYLSMMAGYASEVAEFQGDGGNTGVSSRVQAVVDLYGPTDLTVPEAQNNQTCIRFFGKPYAEMPEAYKQGSPLTHLDKTDPPTLIIQGTLDDIVKPSQSDALAEKLKSLGMDYWYDSIDGWPHTLDIVYANFDHTSALIREFLRAKGLGTE